MAVKKLKTKQNKGLKSSVKKSSLPKPARKNTKSEKVISPLVKELVKLAKQLDTNEVSFLINQACVILNNKEIISRMKEKPEPVKGEKRVPTAADFQLPVLNKEKIEFVEAKDGSHFIIVIGNARNFFAREEMKKIVAVCHAADDEKDGMQRLHTWFTRNRSDVLNSTEITGPADTALRTIYNAIIETYVVPQK